MELIGPTEAGCVTSIVEYKPQSRFHRHDHPGGEEILVLSGVFQDERGSFPAGSYLLNPSGFQHEPFSTDGCTIFVKLRQYWGREVISMNWKDEALSRSLVRDGVHCLTLLHSGELLEQACLIRAHTASSVLLSEIFSPEIVEGIANNHGDSQVVAHVAEIFVVEGSCRVVRDTTSSSTDSEPSETAELKELSWMRIPWPTSGVTSVMIELCGSDVTSVLYVKLSSRRI
jgi:hypothetical protein